MRPTLDLGSWCILRMASTDTLRVAKSLGDAGLGVWTPVEKRVARLPRRKARVDRESPLMPSYAFGRVEHVDELLRLAVHPGRDHPRFSVFRYNGGIPLIADEQLDALRGEEERTGRLFDRWKRRGRKGPRLMPGTEVKLSEGPFAGIEGIVEDVQGQNTLVNFCIFGKPMTIKVASLLLLDSVAQGGLPIEATAARAA